MLWGISSSSKETISSSLLNQQQQQKRRSLQKKYYHQQNNKLNSSINITLLFNIIIILGIIVITTTTYNFDNNNNNNNFYYVSSFPIIISSSTFATKSTRTTLLLSRQSNTKINSRHNTKIIIYNNNDPFIDTSCTITNTMSLTTSSLSLFRLRGGGGDEKEISPSLSAATSTSSSSTATATTSNTNKKIRIVSLDSIRVFLIIGIVMGHFYSFSQISNPFLLKFFSQHNILVGGFFALSGYVTAYTCSENNIRQVSNKVIQTPKQLWILQKVFSYIPLHWLILLIFSPMFIYVDMKYNGLPVTIWNGFISITLLQSYFPNKGAEVWNSPTWFLSSLTLSTIITPYILPSICSLSKQQLIKSGYWIFIIYILPKLGYCYDHNSFFIPEAITAPKLIPNLVSFNIQRFHPFMNIAEVLLGMIACRIVMLDNEVVISNNNKKDDDDKNNNKATLSTRRITNGWSTGIPLLTIVSFLCLRASNIPTFRMSELLARSIVFIPFFLRFIMACHRQTILGNNNDIVLKILSNKYLISFSTYVFPIYMIHGPIGQMFYKKIIANALWGKVLYGPQFFILYLLTTFVSAYLLQTLFVQNKYIQNKSNQLVQQLSKWF